MTFGVYGIVAGIVKMDDVGLWLGSKRTAAARSFGRGLVHAMPVVFTALSAVTTLFFLPETNGRPLDA